MSRDDDVISGEIDTPIAFVSDRVSEEGTSGESESQFMRCLCEEVEIAGATEHPQVLIGGGDTVESDIRAGFTDRLVGKPVQQIHDSVEPICPVANWKRSLKE
jgi:hypothetical protein